MNMPTQEAKQIAEEAYNFSAAKDEDGSVTIYLQHESPGPENEANWLPAPGGPLALALRIYWPEQEVLDDKWEPSGIKKALASAPILQLSK